MSQAIETQIARMLESAVLAQEAQSSQSYEKLDLQVRRLQELSREAYQAQVKGQVMALVEKLEYGHRLDAHEQHLLALLIVGDARKLLESENRLPRWQEEIVQTLALLEKSGPSAAGGDPESLLALDAACHMLRSVLPELTFYLREKERLVQFESNDLANLGAENSKVLAEILRGMMESLKA